MWQQIRSNQVRSIILVTGMLALLLVMGYFLGVAFLGSGIGGLIIALVIWVVMNMVALFQGDNILLFLAKAKKIERNDYPRLYNVVEEMKIASGLERMPDIYIIDDPALNAFATGRNPKRASIAITSGLLQKLNRDELQGVIGHELAHIKNRDVLLMALCSVLLGTIVMLSWYAMHLLFFQSMTGSRRSSGGGGGGGGAIILIIGIVLVILAPLFAQLIYFAISRKREYLADASSALYTRYPEGLASALEKLGASTPELKSANQSSAPMYIINPFRKKKGRAATDRSSTHPPISERVRILRSMAGGASYADYEDAYRQVHKGGGKVIPAAAVAGVGAVGLRAAEPEAAPREPEPTKVERTREVTDLMWKMNRYKTITCDCGTKLKVPPKLKRANVKCPHCGRIHSL